MYNQFVQKGMVDESVLKQVLAAMNAYAKKRSVPAAEHAEALLERYVEEYLTGNPHATLNVTIFNAAIDAFAQIGKPRGAQRVFRRMAQLRSERPELDHVLQPDVISFTKLANAWAVNPRLLKAS